MDLVPLCLWFSFRPNKEGAKHALNDVLQQKQVHKYGEYEFPCGDNEVRIDQVSVESAVMRSSWHPSAQPCWKWSRTHKGVSLGYRGQSRRFCLPVKFLLSSPTATVEPHVQFWGGFSIWLWAWRSVCGTWGGWRCLNTRVDVPEFWWGYKTSQEKKEIAHYPSSSMTPILHN